MEFGSDWGGKDYYEKPKEVIKEQNEEEKIEVGPQERKDDKSKEELKRKELEKKIKEQDEEEKRESKEYLEKLKEEAEEKKKLKEEEESQKRKEIEERITKDDKDDRCQQELNDKDKEKVNDETKDIESEKIKEKIDDREKEEVHEGIIKKEIEEYRKETIEAIKAFADADLMMYLKEFSIEKKISANNGTELRPEFKEYIRKLNDGFIDPYRENLLEKCDQINEKHLFDKYIIDILYNADNPLEFISNYEKHTGLEINSDTVEKIAKENNIEIKIFADTIHKDINEIEVSENQLEENIGGLEHETRVKEKSKREKFKERISDEKRRAIIVAGTADDHGSLNSLAKEFKSSRNSIRKILVEVKGEDWVKAEYKPPERILDEKRKAIIEAGTAEGHVSLNNLSKEFETNRDSIKKILVEVKGEDWVKAEYKPPERILDEKRKAIIEAGTAEGHGSLRSLSKEFETNRDSIRKILVEVKGEDWVKAEYKPPERVSDEKRRAIIEAGMAEGHGSLRSLSKEFETSADSIMKILKKVKGENWVKAEYKPPERIPEEKRREIIEVGKAEGHGSLTNLAEEFETSKRTIRKILVEVKGEDWVITEYKPPEKILDEKRRAIIEAGTAEDHGSLNNLSKEFNVSPGTARKILVKVKGEDWVKAEYKPPEKILDEKRIPIIEAGTVEGHGSLTNLAEEFKSSRESIRDILVEVKGENWVKAEYKPLEKISDEKRRAIIEAGTAEGHGSLNSLAEEFETTKKGIRKILVEVKEEDWFKEEYPAPEKIPDEKRIAIIEAGTAENHPSMDILAEEFEIAEDSVRRILEEVKGDDWVKEEFPQGLPKEKGTLTHNLVKSHITKVFDVRRKQSPDIPKMISEPSIYSGSLKSADIGFKNIPNNLKKFLIKNDLFQRLNIDPEDTEHIRFVQFDFTNAVTKKNIINKAVKYQHHKVLTFIVGTSWRREDSTINIPNDKAIMYPENIKVISYDLFVDLLDLQGEERDDFIEIIKLNEGNKMEALREMWENDDQEFHYAGKDLKGFLENNTSLDFWMDKKTNFKKKVTSN